MRIWLSMFRLMVVLLMSASVLADQAEGKRGVVASVNPIASRAGLAVLKNGGNAMDAAVATALMLGVVDGHNSGIGGGCFILIRRPDGSVVAIDGREMAPAAATRDMYVREGKVVGHLSKTGALAVGVPGSLAAYEKALSIAGTKPMSGFLESAAQVAEQGFAIDRVMARNIRQNITNISKFSATSKVLLRSPGVPIQEGEDLVQSDLAFTYRAIAKHGISWFYSGGFSERTSSWMRDHGGLITKADLANYKPVVRRPVFTIYRGFHVYGFPPPSSGGIHVAQVLNILENFDVRAIHQKDPAEFVHLVSEAMKLAFADRAHWLGDSDFAKVPRGLVDKRYAAKLAKRIDLKQATHVESHGLPPDWQDDVYGKHTTHIAAADREGNYVAITATVNTSFGSKVMIPGTGVFLNNQMDDFSARSGVANAFGLVGAENNSIAPGKRPLSSMSPTIVVKNGKPILTLGAAGGPKIITEVLLALIRHVDLNFDLHDSVRSARFHHQWNPNTLFVEKNMPNSIVARLESYGHHVKRLSSAGVLQAIGTTPDGKLQSVSDPRVPGKALGW